MKVKVNFSRVGFHLSIIENSIASRGYSSFLIVKNKITKFLSDEDIAEYAKYSEERAAESLSLDSGNANSHIFGGPYVSSYIREVAESNPVSGGDLMGLKVSRLIANDPTKSGIVSLIMKEAKDKFAAEAGSISPWSDEVDKKSVIDAISYYSRLEGDDLAVSTKISDGFIYCAYSLSDDISLAMIPFGKVSFSTDFSIIPWRPYVVVASPEEIVGKHASKVNKPMHGMDIDRAVYGFNLYQISRSASQAAHAFKAYLCAAKVIYREALVRT